MKKRGRSCVKITIDPATLAELEDVYSAAECPKDRQKAHAVLLATEGLYSYERIGQIVRRARRTVVTWCQTFLDGGLGALLGHAPQPGRPSKMKNPEVTDELRAGLEEGRWVIAQQAREWLRETHGIDLSASATRYWLGKFNGAHKVPRPVHTKKDEAAAEAFKAHLYENLCGLDIPVGTRVRVWVADEARYGLHDRLRRCWSLRGVRLVKRMQLDYQWGYAYGAVDVLSGAGEFLVMPSVSLEFTHLFLRQVAARDPGAVHVVIWDNAGFHPRAGAASLPSNVRLLPLPAYSPELNPVEKLWEHLRDRIGNTVYGVIDAMDDAVCGVLKTLAHSPWVLRGLVGEDWLALQANALS